MSNAFFAPADDKELKDPDGAANTDGGTNMPEHKTAGDSLTARQEFRGFILDNGSGPSGHQRLGAAQKELLVETDVMENVPDMPAIADIEAILNTVDAGFSDPTNGAGIYMYYVIDETAAAHAVFNDDVNFSDSTAWAAAHRNAKLKVEFVHQMFTDKHTGTYADTGAFTWSKGSFIFVTTEKNSHDNDFPATNFNEFLAHTASHELVHALMNTDNANGFDNGEHLADPDADGTDNDPDDEKYLMYEQTTIDNVDTIIFSETTISQLDLTSKETVERV